MIEKIELKEVNQPHKEENGKIRAKRIFVPSSYPIVFDEAADVRDPFGPTARFILDGYLSLVVFIVDLIICITVVARL